MKTNSKHFAAISVMGKDRPGIVASITRVLFKAGCNIEDSSMTRLRSEFAMIVLADLPSRLDSAALQKLFAPLQEKEGLSILVRGITATEEKRGKSAWKSHMLSVYGADRPGIVYRISRILAARRVNITDVQTNKRGSAYVMLLEIELPKKLPLKSLNATLQKEARALHVNIGIRPVESPQL